MAQEGEEPEEDAADSKSNHKNAAKIFKGGILSCLDFGGNRACFNYFIGQHKILGDHYQPRCFSSAFACCCFSARR